MFVDRRKDNYDELLVLARDARMSRKRVNRWSTGLIIAAFLGTAAYVATMNQQVNELRETADAAQKALDGAEGERDLLRAELEALVRYHDFYADIAPSQNIGDSISELGDRLGFIPRVPVTDGGTTVTQFATSNIVWMVDGSRRFPMIDGDILWIPDGNFWIRMKKAEDGSRELYRHDERPVGGVDETGGVLLASPHREETRRGSFDCIEITLHDESLRQLFRDAGYVDVEVTYFISDSTNQCR